MQHKQPTIIKEKINIFHTKADILVNPVNCIGGVMGAGLAKQFAERYPEILNPHKQACKNEWLRLEHPYFLSNHTPVIVLFPTKHHWKENSRYDKVYKGIVNLRTRLSDSDIYQNQSIAIPLLGCGLGGLESDIVIKYLESEFAKVPYSCINEVIICI